MRIGITVGDVGGIGPELIVKAISELSHKREIKYMIFSPEKVFEKFKDKPWARDFFDCESVDFVPVSYAEPLPAPGEERKEGGILAYNSIRKAVRYAFDGKISAIVTSPISKYALSLAKRRITGHTELLGKLTKTKNTLMLFWGDKLKVALLTTHIPIKKVPKLTKRMYIEEKISLLNEFFTRITGGSSSKFAILGLNPHSGERGIIGKEEEEEFVLAIKMLKEKGVNVDGPFPSDAFFGRGLYEEYTVTIAVYHDQGLIPFKMLEPHGVNVTLGLPFVRTSPSHGTAFNIADKFVAEPLSMINAIKLAYELTFKIGPANHDV
ncbi:MAG: 4-hydroxythreonine-4-phosphate dehydrogenase PdxA [bacterium]